RGRARAHIAVFNGASAVATIAVGLIAVVAFFAAIQYAIAASRWRDLANIRSRLIAGRISPVATHRIGAIVGRSLGVWLEAWRPTLIHGGNRMAILHTLPKLIAIDPEPRAVVCNISCADPRPNQTSINTID